VEYRTQTKGSPGPACKCCGGATAFFACHDFSRTCEDYKEPAFAPSGIDVPYYRCAACGFVFTSYFDAWSKEDFAERIYNSEYILADPDFAGTRPQYIAHQLSDMLAPLKADITLLDYGGGEGTLTRELKQRGFEKSESFDPFFSSGTRPRGPFDLVTIVEVVEHAVDPIPLFRDALSFVAPDGAILFTTGLQARKPDPDWWYIAPRNGHVSIHTPASLQRLAAAAGVQCLSLNENLHMLYRNARSVFARQIAGTHRSGALFAASKRGLWPFIRTKSRLDELGVAKGPGHTRHLARAVLTSSGLI
jgi:2-polyprenyl-6-hydroxyphenyl methylase/3-demethylubiquinone-9 3-methyltransferase